MSFINQSFLIMCAVVVLVLGHCASRALSRALNERKATSMRHKHEQWMAKYGRTYKDVVEKEKHFNVFKKNVEYTENFKSASSSNHGLYTLGVNKFADLTAEEFVTAHASKTTNSKYENIANVPPSMDWREKGAATRMKNQQAQIGVCYGNVGNNLPSPQDVVNLYKSNGIGAMRLYSPDQAALRALQGSGILTILDVPRDELQSIGSDPNAANQWVQSNVIPFASSIKYIAVGNEIHASDQEASSVQPAMQNILNALNSNNLGVQIKVSTAIDTTLITNSFPPSNGQFSDTSYITPLINFLTSNGSPLLVSVYPYFAYINDEQSIKLEYALFTAPGTVVTDSNNGLQYQNLFDAILDAVYAALEKAGAPNTAIIVSESGWPSDGGEAATVENAGTYYRNLINHVKQGTPLKAGQGIETYLFAMFDENNKQGAPTEQHFGLFTPAQQPKYGQLNFS